SFITYQQLWANGDFPNSSNSEFGQYYNQLQLKPILEIKSHVFNGHALKTKIGIDTSFQNFKQTNVISDSNQNSYALFVMPSVDITDSLTAGTGGRFGYITTNGTFSNGNRNSDITPVYAYLFFLEQKWNKHYTTGARISRDYQLPFIDQSSLTPSAQTTFGLNPQTSISYSLSQKVSYDAWNVGFNAFYMSINNQIVFNPLIKKTGAQFGGANVNLPPTEQYGIILSGGIQPVEVLGLGGSLTLSKNVFKNGANMPNIGDVSGNSVPGISNILAEVHSNYQIIKPINWYLQLLYTGNMYADGDFQNSLGQVSGYFLLNTSVSYKLSNWLFSIRVNNIFNQRYNYFTTTYDEQNLAVYPADGTNGALMVTYEFK
ncbi:MAG: outer membrane receptor for ferrienterochelin and colicin, partial [Francisellaceae bacterium]